MRIKTLAPWIFLIACVFRLSTAHALQIGDPAPLPAKTLGNYDGKNMTLADIKGANGKLVIFSCNQCPYSNAWEARIVEIGNMYAGKGIGVVMINSNEATRIPGETASANKKRAETTKMNFPYVIDADSELARAFGATRTPEVFLFDKNNKLVYHGAVDDSADAAKMKEPYLKNALDALLDAKPIAKSETKFIGCGIKFAPLGKKS